VYTNIVDNHKIRLLAFEDRWHFVAIMACKQSGLFGNADPEFINRSLAVKLGLQLPALDELKKRLIDVHLIDKKWNVLKWDERQYKTDSSSDRVRKHREKQRLSEGVTDVKRYGNVPVTPPDTDAEADADTEKQKHRDLFDRVSLLGVDDLLWEEFIKTRAKLKAMNTPRALAQLVKRAEELSEKGENIKELMEEANSNGWKTIYEKDGRDERRKNRSASKIARDDRWMR
jgi:hypothetical protein